MAVQRDGAPGQFAPDGRTPEAARALQRALASETPDERTLRAAVAAFVEACKAQSLGPETMLVALKAHARDQASGRLDARGYETLLARTVRWAIDAYYGPRTE